MIPTAAEKDEMCDVSALSSRLVRTQRRGGVWPWVGRPWTQLLHVCLCLGVKPSSVCTLVCTAVALQVPRGTCFCWLQCNPPRRRLSLPAPVCSEHTDTNTGRGRVRNKKACWSLATVVKPGPGAMHRGMAYLQAV